ncbi:kinase, putative [Ricinus communis]|uniref:Kinase, putative n=1 Tax=Ricinus communis TaxID=3988 RepID=B9RGQ3_RICCO|nr:kinase, putative [Ricinus communis]
MAVSESVAKPKCVDRCGNLIIPYPFGMGASDCYWNEWYAVGCKKTKKSHTPFLRKVKSEILKISLEESTLLLKSPVISSNCSGVVGETGEGLNLKGSPFYFSTENAFTAMGCNSFTYIADPMPTFMGCWLNCDHKRTSGEVENRHNDRDYCQGMVVSGLQVWNISIERYDYAVESDGRRCRLAFLAEESWFGEHIKKSSVELEKIKSVAVLVDWFFEGDDETNKETVYCDHREKSVHYNERRKCKCKPGYNGNPYLPSGCSDIDECKISEQHGCHWPTTSLKKSKKIKRRKEFFKRVSKLHLNQDDLKKTSMFSLQDMEKATDHFNNSRIIGQGGQGKVYKGMLTDGKNVAIKISNAVDELRFEEFINEVVILLQINHRNVVKLLGCCLETEVPLLVYEYMSHGTLSENLHNKRTDFHLSWKMRLQIAVQISRALSYLQFAARTPIYHRDIKSTNILLDEKYGAKLSDFGISRSIASDQTHRTTGARGTPGYMDPEYFRTGEFTERSDVYSFGVVLVELLTGRKPTFSSESEESISLAELFNQSMRHDELFDIIDPQIMEHYVKEEVITVANVAKKCLNLIRDRRPTMTEVAMELEGIRFSKEDKEQSEEIDSNLEDGINASTYTSFRVSA